MTEKEKKKKKNVVLRPCQLRGCPRYATWKVIWDDAGCTMSDLRCDKHAGRLVSHRLPDEDTKSMSLERLELPTLGMSLGYGEELTGDES